MKFCKKTRYGLTALVDLAAQPSTTPVALKTIAERNDISLQFLEHIFASFRRTGIVKSVKGSQGGYNLAKAADEITVASVVEALEGSYHLEDEDVLAENSYKGISDTIQKLVVDSVNQELDQILSNLTLAQMSGYYSDHYDNLGITGYGLTKKMQSASGVNQSIEGNRKPSFTSKNEKTAQLGIGVLAGYSWNNIYDLFGTYKSDASSILPSDKRWNSAWAVGAGWSLKNYPFLRDNGVLTELKLRASYGCTASLQGVSPSSAVATFQYSEDAYGDDQLLSLMGLYNADLKPEQTIDIDAGISLGLWNRVTLNAGWYRRRTKDALLDVPIPASNGFTTLKRNIGILENSGIEGELYVKMVDRNNWRMSGRLNLAYNQNKVVDLYHTDCLYTSEYDMVPSFEVGKSYDMIYGPVSLGINPMTGLPVFRGADGRTGPPCAAS